MWIEIVSIVLTIFFGLLSLMLFLRGRHRKRLTLTWQATTLQTRKHPEVVIQFKGKQVENLTRVRAVLWNSGNVDIRRSDIPSEGHPSIELTGAEMLSVVVVEASPATQCSVEQQHPRTVSVDFEFLNPNDYAVLDIFCELAEPKSLSLKFSATLVGGLLPQSIEFVRRWRAHEVSPAVLVFTVMFLGGAYFWVRSIPYWVHKTGSSLTLDIIPALVSLLVILFVGLGALGLVSEWVRQRRVYRVPSRVEDAFKS